MNPPAYRQITPDDLLQVGDPVVVCTFMRSGTHLTIDLIRRQFAAFHSWKLPIEPNDSLYFPVDILLPNWEPPNWDIDRVLKVLRRPKRPVIKTHFLEPGLAALASRQPAVAEWLRQRGTFIYVRRDPRRVLPSLWAIMPEWKPEDAGPFDRDFIRRHFAAWREHVASWTREPGVTVLDFDDVIVSPLETLKTLAQVLQEPLLNREPLLPSPLRSRFHSRCTRFLGFGSPSTAVLTLRDPPPWPAAFDELLESETQPAD